MTFQEAVRNVLSNYVTFSGRAPRSEFWWWTLAVLIAVLVAGLLDGLLFGAPEGESVRPISGLLGLAILLPNLAVTVRRLHDTDRTGWWVLLGLVPVIGLLVLLWFYVQKGSEGANRFG
ncbi:MAG TPA: DUF805 domain-containing protein [Amaricoccus sp.]|mgnify:CR=1 FL=1|uniref:DUF805 domain-containing protein n=1 Tax=Amaricoccus sp. TaxID=1872485 RepID=UPI002C94905F|nr:DUF805 domain-containing protein [Amaricoccus sp.]HMQ92720.1 DUF805 domain-containing protein [Amaricoccus sp.]HMR52537.1 DUF805 domain-containing protein [Amaricoccus sp.]HMR60533.1 DUF805 domain-containing protein [Amaricoccus sp.]HMT99458.1 DUF805 domain-containing protein [Amaricoccus sp.]